MKQKKEFTGVWIPKHIIEDIELSPIEKMIWSEIASFEMCYFKNEQLGERYGKSGSTISRIIAKLKKKKYIEEVDFNGRQRGMIAKNDDPAYAKMRRQGTQKCVGRVRKNAQADYAKMRTKDNSKDNSKDNIKIVNKKTKKFIKNLKEELKEIKINKEAIDELRMFVDYWTEPNKSKTKLRWELQPTWDMRRRIGTWMRNKQNWNFEKKEKGGVLEV